MNLRSPTFRFQARSLQRSRRGYATVVVLALLGLLLVLVASGTRALNQLKREMRLIEQRQVQRVNAAFNPVVSESTPSTLSPSNQTTLHGS
jgi:hypothetical protein